MDKLYLKSLHTADAQYITMMDTTQLGSYVSLLYGDDAPCFKTHEHALQHLVAIAHNNARVGITNVIFDSTGAIIYKLHLQKVETYLQ